MEIKSIDVSSYQGKPDWAKVKKAGINFAILRIHQKNGPDTSFEHNYKGCRANKIAVGGYKYSYALTEAQALKEAEETLAVLDGRELDLPVFYDLEWEKQRKLGKEAVEKIAVVFLDHIKKAGYKVGIYCNVDWYQNVLSTKLKSYDLWLARYPANDDGTVQTRLKPEQGIGWQYSSKGKVAGISGNVDMDLFYKDYKEKAEEKKKTTGNKLEKHIKLGNYYANYGGKKPYLEKKSNAYLDDFTRNAGSKNYTKFARDVNNWGQPGCQGQPWCAVYQFWKLVKIFGLARAQQIMGGGFYNCRSVTRHAKQKGTWHSTPKKGALVVFRNGAHIGSITKYDDIYIYTNEGNTSSTPGVVANGGSCRNKKYKRTDPAIDGYVWIDYGTASDQRSTETAIHLDKTPKWVGMVNTAELNVRSWAGTEYPRIKKYPLLAQHNLVDVCNTIKADDGTAWYYVRIVNKYYGFVAARYITKV
nr:glycoside hydrolase family 25 protein [uncultured Blautia sp.]